MSCRLGTIPRCCYRFYVPGHTSPPKKSNCILVTMYVKWLNVKSVKCAFLNDLCQTKLYIWCICNHLTLQMHCRLVPIKLFCLQTPTECNFFFISCKLLHKLLDVLVFSLLSLCSLTAKRTIQVNWKKISHRLEMAMDTRNPNNLRVWLDIKAGIKWFLYLLVC
jgi:hypothetical protein